MTEGWKMWTMTKNWAMAGVVVLVAALAGGSALGAEGYQLRLRPEYPSQPRLGFEGHYDYGHGMHVDRVPWGTLASRIGLEADDVIVAIDGQRIRSLGHYYSLLRHSGGRATLYIEDHRTGRVVTRNVWLNGGHDHHHHDHGHDHGHGLVFGG